ncbi:NADPH-dependent F420 reductase [Pararhizobium sp. PWRC1-1]|uniref:NADPH-dependent F420 reductase n=1 Tax=Pararhizobium sp. PWRC1-1 TaxID=2804566 RepID=UPI003CF199A8
MTYSIIGSGAIGSAIARHFASAGIPVAVANTRGPDSLRDFADRFGGAVKPTELASALEADIVILAIPHDAVKGVLAKSSGWKGRIIIDATNAIDPATFGPADLGGEPSSFIVAKLAPGSKLVKGFNHILAKILTRDPDDGRGYGKRTLFISGDVPDAKQVVSELMQKFGFAVIDLGTLSEGGLLQQYGAPLTGHSLVTQELKGSSFADMDVVVH